jgi:MFS transporter, DHA2 family, multidrug resistance protein
MSTNANSFLSPAGRPIDDETVLSPEFVRLSHNRKLGILLAASLIAAVEIASRIAINVILPDMQGNVAGDVDEISWVLTLYNMGFICSIALTPWMTRTFGARRHYTICTVLYSVGALGCFLSAHSLTLLLTSRTIMGLGGGFFFVRFVIMGGLFFQGKAKLIPLTLSYGILFGMQILYPTAMGAICDALHWNYAFLLDLPFLLIGILLLRWLLPEGHVRRERWRVESSDYWGAGFLIVALVALQIATSRGERDLWFESPFITTLFVLSIVGLALFVWWDSRPENVLPVLHLRHVFQLPPLRNAILAAMIVGALLGAGLYVIPQYLRIVQDYSTTQTGEFISLYSLGFGSGAMLTLRVFVPRLGPRLSSIVGMILFTITFIAFVYSWTPTTPSYLTGALTNLQGFAQGMVTIGVANAITGVLGADDIWEGDTTYFFVRQLGNTFGLTAVTILFDRRMTFHSSRLLDVANRLDPTTSATLSSYAGLIARTVGGASDPQLGALALFQKNVVVQSSLLSYIDISAFLAALCFLGAITAVLLKPPPPPLVPTIPAIHC